LYVSLGWFGQQAAEKLSCQPDIRDPHVWDIRTHPRRMLKQFVQQGRSE
jgi:hypothetical protein